MNITLDEFLLNVRWADALDILILAVVIYLVGRWLQRRATRSAVIALLGLGGLYVISQVLSMYLTLAVFQAGLTVMLFALVVIFQDDLRHGAARLVLWRPFSSRTTGTSANEFIHPLVEAVTLLAKEHIGALIVFPGRHPLERHIRGGTRVDAVVSVELLHSIFHPGSRGHDGAVIIRNGRIHRLGVHLPLSANLSLVGERGTRHAAALGLAERTDALVIVISEETGLVSLAVGGSLVPADSPAELENRLQQFLEHPSDHLLQPTQSWARLRMLGAQLGCLLIAAAVWFVFAFRIETVQRTFSDVPVEFRNLPEQWALEDVSDNTLQLTLTGPERAFAALEPESLRAIVDLSGVSGGGASIPIRERHLNLPNGIRLRDSDPPSLQFQLRRTSTVTVPVRVATRGQPPQGWELDAAIAEPAALTVHVPSEETRRYEALLTEPIDLSRLRESVTMTVPVRLPPGVRSLGDDIPEVRVRIEIRRTRAPASQPME